MSAGDLRSALVLGFADAFGGTPPKTQYENSKGDFSGETLWTHFIYLPGQPVPATIGINGEDEERGLLQIDINVPAESGEKHLFSAIQTLQNFFTAGRVVSYNGSSATILSCGSSSGRLVDTWYRRSITIQYYSRTTRPNLN